MSKNDATKTMIDRSRVMVQIVASLTDDSRGVIYYRNMFIVQATDDTPMKKNRVQWLVL
jgi:hypothetical protein